MISYDAAMSLLAQQVALFPKTTRPVFEANQNILATDLYAPFPSPRFDNSAMDGYAFCAKDLEHASTEGLKICGEVFAGQAVSQLTTTPAGGSCIKIMTGAPIPPGYDTVIAVEKTRISTDGERVIWLDRPAKGANIRYAGEDIKNGEVILREGTFLDPERLMLCAYFGFPELPVYQPPRVLLYTTGDELADPGSDLREGEVFNCSKTYITAALRTTYGLIPDVQSTLKDDLALASRLVGSDLESKTDIPTLILTTGAVSAGERDFIPQLALDLGFKPLFHKVAMRPGKPIFCAQKNHCLWLGLPGNPISTAVGWQFFARPLLHYWAKYPFPKQQKASMIDDVAKPEGLRCFYRGFLQGSQVSVHPKQGSAHMLATISANAYISLSEPVSLVKAGTIVDVQII